MPVLGCGGKLVLRREAPTPCVLNPESLDADNNRYSSLCDENYWSGDKVSVDCLPEPDPNFPPDPGSWATYFNSSWFLGPNRDHITASDHAFYKTDEEEYPDGEAGDDAQFYARVGDTSGGEEIRDCDPSDHWIHVDQLGRVSFYNSRCDALSGCERDRIDLEAIGKPITIAPFGSLEYQNAVWECVSEAGDYQFSDVEDSVTLETICDNPPDYERPDVGTDEFDNANVLPREGGGGAVPYWQCTADLREWTLQLEALSVDTTSVSEKFGEAVKSLVNGGGTTEFFVERRCTDDDVTDSTILMKLLLLTSKGCKADAQFYMIQRDGCGSDCEGLIKGDLYYETQVLITNTAVNLRPTEIVAGSASFVTTGEIALRETP